MQNSQAVSRRTAGFYPNFLLFDNVTLFRFVALSPIVGSGRPEEYHGATASHLQLLAMRLNTKATRLFVPPGWTSADSWQVEIQSKQTWKGWWNTLESGNRSEIDPNPLRLVDKENHSLILECIYSMFRISNATAIAFAEPIFFSPPTIKESTWQASDVEM
jgi:hypothetical protein